MKAPITRDAGFTMVELLIAMTLMTVVVTAVAALSAGTGRLADRQPQLIDAQQRARVIADLLTRELSRAGAGLEESPSAGSLASMVPAVWPRRVGRLREDLPTEARSDVVTILSVPETLLQTRLAAPWASGTTTLLLAPCASGRLPCRAGVGDTVAIFDDRPYLDLLTVDSVSGQQLGVRSLASSSGTFGGGAVAVEVRVRGYYYDRGQSQLRYYDGDGTDQPVVDDVGDVAFSFFGDADAPRYPRPELGVANCLYDAEGAWIAGPSWVAQEDGVASIPLAALSDGPWCGSGATRFDVDLLRIRRIRVHLTVDDYRMAFDVTPPNLMRTVGADTW